MTRVVLRVLGSVIAVACDPETAAALSQAWGGSLVDASTPADVVLRPDLGGAEVETPVELASMALNAAALDRYAGLALHAGVVGDSDRLVVLPGESGRGKTTLTAACLLAGFGYVSDEALCLERSTGTVQAFAKPLGLSAASLALLGLAPPPAGALEALIPPQRLGVLLDPTGRRATDIVEPMRRPGPPTLTALHRAEALSLLLPRCFNHYRDPAGTFALLTDLARTVRVWRLDYDEPSAAAALLREALPTGD